MRAEGKVWHQGRNPGIHHTPWSRVMRKKIRLARAVSSRDTEVAYIETTRNPQYMLYIKLHTPTYNGDVVDNYFRFAAATLENSRRGQN